MGVEILSQDLSGMLTRRQRDRTQSPSAGCKEGEPDLWVSYASWGAMDAISRELIVPLTSG